MTRKVCGMVPLIALSLLALAAQPAEAAPQILGLVASNGVPTPLRSENGVCSGFISSFCLQFDRPSPKPDSEYHLASGGGITVIGRRADGSAMRLAAGGLVTILSHAGFSSVTISLPEGRLKAIGAVTAAIEIGPLTSIMPVAMAGDSNPQTPAEIDYATNTQRRLAQSTFETSSQTSDAAKLTALVINSLPADEPTSQGGREAVWKNAMMQVAGAPLDPQAFAIASLVYRRCGAAVDSRTASALGVCLEQAQQDFVNALEFELQGRSAAGPTLDQDAGGS
jgi:hypothetical protein